MLLAIETSCDETAVAIMQLKNTTESLSSCLLAEQLASQTKLHQDYGGVVPELAAREHVRALPLLVDQALHQAGLTVADITAVAVTAGPGLKVCLLVGLSFAKAFCLSRDIPLVPVNHLEAHAYAWALTERNNADLFPMLTLLVSGGHTELLLARSADEYARIAATIDDAAGEAFDKIASMLGLAYPGGPALAKLAESGNRTEFNFPLAMPNDAQHFSFSGLKTAVLREVQAQKLNDNKKINIAASAESAIVQALLQKTSIAMKKYQPRTLFLTGGVAANLHLRMQLEQLADINAIKFIVPPVKWCTDNAAMIAARAHLDIQKEKMHSATSSLGPMPRLAVGQSINN